MDVIAGDIQRNDDPSFKPTDLFHLWQQDSDNQLSKAEKADLSKEEAGVFASRNTLYAKLRPKQIGFLSQIRIFICRALLQQARQRVSISLDIALVLVTGVMLGLMFSNNSDLRKIGALALLTSLGIGLSVGASSLRCFGDERIVFLRESTSGINRCKLASDTGLLPF